MNKDKALSALVAMVVTALLALALAVFSTEGLDTYGSGLFIATPMVCGAISVLLYNRKGKKELKESLSVSFIGGCIALSLFLVVGFEGLICLAMAVPVVLPLFLLGGFWALLCRGLLLEGGALILFLWF